jgi:YD repeat-containing protein
MYRPLLAAILTPVLLAACGGGGQDNSPGSTPATAPYQFRAPKAGAHLVYSASLVDNLNNTLNRTVTDDVTAVNADGSFAVHEEDPSHDTNVSGVTDQTLYPTDFQYNAAGQPTAWTVAGRSGSVQCTVSGASGAPALLATGGSWSTAYTETCGTGPGAAYTQSGTLAGIESVTVPAGTFTAYKFVVTTTRTLNGVTRVESTTRWRDQAGSDSRTIKEATVFTYSGATPPAGALQQQVRELQSYR